jgi:hypothetical protein
MSSISDVSLMLAAMKRATESLLSAGQREDAAVIKASESIIRAYFAKYFFPVEPAMPSASCSH